MANNDDLILRGKALKDLHGIKDVLHAQGDPILASILNRAIECIENQPSQETRPIDGALIMAAKYRAALKDLAAMADCDFCRHEYEARTNGTAERCTGSCETCPDPCVCSRCGEGSMWEWRGANG